MQFRACRESEEWKDELVEQQTQGTFAGQSRDDYDSKHLLAKDTLRQMDLQWEERLNQSMKSMEQRFMDQLQEQKEIQRALEEKLYSMMQDTMGLPIEAPTAPRVSIRGSCSAVEPTEYSGQYDLLVDGDPPRIVAVERFTRPQKQLMHELVIDEDDEMDEAEDDPLSKLMTRLPRYMDTIIVDQGRSSMYGFVEPQTIQPSGNTLESKQYYLQTWITEPNRDVYLVSYIDGKMKNDLRSMIQGVMGKSRGQLVQVLYPKVCNKQLDS
ncbi:hypothetical protein LR48_Vigan07g198400 [Vigna angularis]|uniref:Uncharacterized protein n=1 Tax=Phaseolus angularis TaxID=3914 RepID=A0A0L9UZI2_PHAAN|nr:hypothetical protein LR48_Vigan07g198400 [Vigna angularis]